jgi:hypothetical protein
MMSLSTKQSVELPATLRAAFEAYAGKTRS